MSDTIHNISSDGTKIARGRSQVADGGTISTGIRTSGFVGKCESADTVVAATGISGQTVTVALDTAGSGATGNHFINWEAWDMNKT